MCPGSRGAPLGAAVVDALEDTGALLIGVPMTELAEVATPAGVEVRVLPGTTGVEDSPPPIGPSVALGKPTTGVDEALLEEVRIVLVGRTLMPPAALLVVLPASGWGAVHTGKDGANGGRLGLGGLGALGGPAQAGVAYGFAIAVTVTVTVSTTVTCWRFSSWPWGKARPPTARAEVRRVEWRMVVLVKSWKVVFLL